jgi:hypothetical protein
VVVYTDWQSFLPGTLPMNSNEWTGRRLWDETCLHDLTPADVEGEGSIEACYQKSMMSDDQILSTCKGTIKRCATNRDTPGAERGGMLHHFRWYPVNRINPAHRVESVYEEINRKLHDACRDGHRCAGRWQGVYEGVALRPKKGGPILAWATWTRSSIKDARRRNCDNDQSVQEVVEIINSLTLVEGLRRKSYLEQSNEILNFDTINGVVPGAASRLFAQLVPRWQRWNYKYCLLWRHKLLQIANPEKAIGESINVPQGNNDASYAFCTDRTFRGIGNKLSEVYAIRKIPGTQELYFVLSTAGYMLAELPDLHDASSRIDAQLLSRFSAGEVKSA